ncbi:MAG: hypothetical protein ACRDC4_15015 [Plesiomonas sp.]
MTKINIKVETPIRKMGSLKKGEVFRYSGGVYMKTPRMVHEGTSLVANSIHLADGEPCMINIGTEVEVFNQAEISLK